MFCPQCGRELANEGRFCRYCGKALDPTPPSRPDPGADNPPSLSTEECFFIKTAEVLVSNLRFATPAATYAMANVSSVRLEIRRPKRTGPLIAALICTIWLGLAAVPPPPSGGVYFAGAGLLASVGSLLAMRTRFVVRVRGGGGESDGLISTNRVLAEQVVQALQQAIVARG
jgi:Family of unknown function (DUF6232)